MVMTDRLFALLPWAPLLIPCGTLGWNALLVFFGGGAAPSMPHALVSVGMPELLILWLVPSALAVLHLRIDTSLSVGDKRVWRRHLLWGGPPVGLIYLCSSDRHIPSGPGGRA
jgi:hypothetical protein